MIVGFRTLQGHLFELWSDAANTWTVDSFKFQNTADLLTRLQLLEVTARITGVIMLGPALGSFSEARTAATIANTVAITRRVAVISQKLVGEIQQTLNIARTRLATGENNFPVAPLYEGEPHITRPRI